VAVRALYGYCCRAKHYFPFLVLLAGPQNLLTGDS
jgi:hypothetical protein